MKTQPYIQNLIRESNQLIENQRNQISNFNKKVLAMEQEIQARNQQINHFQELTINADGEQLIRSLNIKDLIQLIACLKEVACEIKGIYTHENEVSNLKLFDNIKNSSSEISKSLGNSFHRYILQVLTEAEKMIMNDLKQCRENENKLRAFDQEVSLKYQNLFVEKVLDESQFKNFSQNQIDNLKIELKEKAIGKIMLVAEMTQKQLYK